MAVTVPVAVSITEMALPALLPPGCATYTRAPSGVTATAPTAPGNGPGIVEVAITVFVAVSITDTVFVPPPFATYTRDPSGVTATPPYGGIDACCPSATVAVTAFVAALITNRVPISLSAMYTDVPSGLTATPVGAEDPDNGTIVFTVFAAVSSTATAPVWSPT